ncbi:9062_t:CDS:2 [Funneliformis mosseae]|uniref:9062_t:CDS:1 n=1 Tax=Funneliformis mosseae TaxID=27381 RepID=A0A9N9ER22_FUNMO|nr:9062_t:CDS:2 [Funneliformis mosseae]
MVNLKEALRYVFQESSCLGLQLKMGGKFLLRLNIGERPIANNQSYQREINLLSSVSWVLKSFKAFGFAGLGSLGVLFRTPLVDVMFETEDCNGYPSGLFDPKDGELCLNRAKPEETLVEARSGSDVQIDRQIWQKLDKQFYEWAIFDTTKGVSSSRQQDGGHGSWNPLRTLRVILSGTTFSADLGVSSKYSNENFED